MMNATTAAGRYDDIIALPRPIHDGDPFSRRHPRMPLSKRAAIFAPFAALASFDGCIQGMEIPYEPRRALCAEARKRIDRALRRLSSCRGSLADAEYFEPCADPGHPAFGALGLYQRIRGPVRSVDPLRGTLRIGDLDIPFGNLYRLTAVDERAVDARG